MKTRFRSTAKGGIKGGGQPCRERTPARENKSIELLATQKTSFFAADQYLDNPARGKKNKLTWPAQGNVWGGWGNNGLARELRVDMNASDKLEGRPAELSSVAEGEMVLVAPYGGGGIRVLQSTGRIPPIVRTAPPPEQRRGEGNSRKTAPPGRGRGGIHILRQRGAASSLTRKLKGRRGDRGVDGETSKKTKN